MVASTVGVVVGGGSLPRIQATLSGLVWRTDKAITLLTCGDSQYRHFAVSEKARVWLFLNFACLLHGQ